RCFLRNRDDDLYIAASITAECNTLRGTESTPERLRITPVSSEIVNPGCKLPENYTGEWINTANLDADVIINSTHIVETWYPDEGRYRKTIYVCRERRGSRYLMARLTVDGCCLASHQAHILMQCSGQSDLAHAFTLHGSAWNRVAQKPEYLPCPINGYFTFYQRGDIPFETRILNGVTDSPRPQLHCNLNISSLKACNEYRDELVIDVEDNICVDHLGRPLDIYTKNPVPIRCPVAGKFSFAQHGEVPFETRILGGVTQSPRPGIYCKQNISDFSVCDQDQHEIKIDETYCLSVDHMGLPVDIYSDPDYKLKCIGYFKENLKSYLITYDELDAYSRYRCWVYQRSDLNRVLMSLAIGPFCNLNQDVDSWNHTEGAAVALVMEEYERERDQCPMHFDDGSDPYKTEESRLTIFAFGSSPALFSTCSLILFNVLATMMVY
ncbi:unnamed protein product, partial [Allacma fusca]